MRSDAVTVGGAQDLAGPPAEAPPIPSPPPNRRVGAIVPRRYALYVAAAAGLHAVTWILLEMNPSNRVIPGPRWAPHLGLLLGMVLVRAIPGHARAAAIFAGLVTTAAVVRPAWGLALAAFCLLTWGISRLPVGALVRVALVVAANGVLPAVRSGLFGEALRAPIFGSTGETLLWIVLLVRSLLYQMECSRLVPQDRTLLGYLGSFATIPMAGGAYLPPVTYRRLLGEYGECDAEKNLKAGLGLIALAILYAWVSRTLIIPVSGETIRQLGVAVRDQGLEAALAGLGQGRLAAALSLCTLQRYLLVAGASFYVIGNLRLVGFNLPSGYRFPFISRTFVDYWQRTNFYMRESQLVLYYLPVAKFLRHHLGKRATAGIAATAAILGHLVVTTFLNILMVSGWSSPVRVELTLLDSGRFAVVGILTVLSVLRMRQLTDQLEVSWPKRIGQTVFVIGTLGANLALWELLIAGLTWSQTFQAIGYALGLVG